MIDFWLAMYSHCEDPQLGEGLGALQTSLLELTLDELLGVPWRMSRFCSYLQGAVTFLEESAEFRLHVWFDLPEGHPEFPHADRGMMCLIQPVAPEGLYGSIIGQIAWLAEPLSADMPEPDPMDWIGVMIRDQGYIAIEESEWSKVLDRGRTFPLMAALLFRHIQGMTSRRILEEALEDDR